MFWPIILALLKTKLKLKQNAIILFYVNILLLFKNVYFIFFFWIICVILSKTHNLLHENLSIWTRFSTRYIFLCLFSFSENYCHLIRAVFYRKIIEKRVNGSCFMQFFYYLFFFLCSWHIFFINQRKCSLKNKLK